MISKINIRSYIISSPNKSCDIIKIRDSEINFPYTISYNVIHIEIDSLMGCWKIKFDDGDNEKK
jgi:hypothetical protein